MGEIFAKDKKAFEMLLKLDVIRGPHSTGVARIRIKDDETELVKNIGTTWDLIKDKRNEFYNCHNGKSDMLGTFKVLMGHNRWATIGAVNEDNAHPFIAGDITGAHNGTLYSWAHKRLEDEDKYGTDSECLLNNINAFGLEPVMKRMEGAWALTWYDKKNQTFNILRNDERPLYYCWSASGRTFYYASEDWMLYTALEKADIKIAGGDEGVFMTAENTHYKFDMSSMASFGPEVLEKSTVKGYDWKTDWKPVYRGGTNNNANPFGRQPPTAGDNCEIKDVEDRIGKYEQFYVDAYCTDEQDKDYVSGWFTNLKGVEARVYTERGTKVYDLLDDVDTTHYYGKVKKVKKTRKGLIYVTFDMRTISPVTWSDPVYSFPKADGEVPDVAEEGSELAHWMNDSIPWEEYKAHNDNIVGHDGKPCTREEFDFDTADGCAWCSSLPQPEECKEIKWLGKRTFLCGDCANSPDVVQYCDKNS